MEVSVVVSMKDLLHLCLVILGINSVFGNGKNPVVRFKDIPFQQKTKILNKTITCGDGTWGKFTTLTYTCDDIKVDGLRLAYGYYPGWGVNENCQETKGAQELAQLCKLMLRTEDKHKELYGAIVNNATCRYTEAERLMFTKKSKRRHVWKLMPSGGNGWLSSLSCMVRS
ncbi:uncharacterized protein [Littorina saxatilis]|uniref:Uncharacterized protein n=1 Tax=Littorina saxatilis TaxID=31220 RepID=A0AAN9ARL5_9CAEN